VVVVFIGLQLAMLLSTMDGTIVVTALPTIGRELGGETSLVWVVTAYLLAQIATMPLYGRIGDIYGRKRVVLLAIGLFTVGSMLCGVAGSMPQLIVARAIQGAGGGGIGALSMAIIGDLVPPRQLGRWLGYQGAIFAIGGVAGPLTGGLFVEYISWRWAFYVNLPLAAASMGIITFALRVPYKRIPHALDLLGSALLMGALISLVLLTSAGGESIDWISVPAVLLALSAIGLTLVFLRHEQRASEPFVPLRVMRDRVVRAADALNFLSGFLFYCGIFFLPVFLQEVAGVSPTVSGLYLAPYMISCAITTLVAGRLVERTGRYRRWPIIGSVLMTAGVALLATIGEGTPAIVASASAAVLGTGVGFIMQTTFVAIQNRVHESEMGIATSAALLFRILGSVIGTAFFGAVLAAGLPADPTVADFASALPPVFLTAIPFGVLSFFVARRLEEHPLRDHARFSTPAPAPLEAPTV
jgi:EmrB/QacA subfamily drug resistance transporter